MARLLNIREKREDVVGMLRRAVQSSHLNWIIGSGCSTPALEPLGNIEGLVAQLTAAGEAEQAQRKLFSFIKPFLDATLGMTGNLGDSTRKTLDAYKSFLSILTDILFERKSGILEKQATIFTTNYDLFMEKAFEEISTVARLNDGFIRIPRLSGRFLFSPSEFFNAVQNSGNVYNYVVRIPSINLIKLHGSLSWQAGDGKILFNTDDYVPLLKEWSAINTRGDVREMTRYCEKLPMVLPEAAKFEQTVLNQTYYELFRIFANQLDKENALLVAEGFSFEDAHIYDLTRRALKNPTLILVIICYKDEERPVLEAKFAEHRNVFIVYSDQAELSFEGFNDILKAVLPGDRGIGPADGGTHARE